MIALYWFLVCSILLPACSGPTNENVVFPEPKPGYVHDFVNVLRPNVVILLNKQLKEVDKKGLVKMAVVVVKSLQGLTVEDYTIQLAKQWKVGDKATDNGIVLLVAMRERKIRIEIGYGNESKLTDGQAKLIIQNSIAPCLKKGDYNMGIQKGVDAIIATLQNNNYEQMGWCK